MADQKLDVGSQKSELAKTPAAPTVPPAPGAESAPAQHPSEGGRYERLPDGGLRKVVEG
jgi:hypothetical protein